MSLINDALKRASQAEKNRLRDPALPPAMQPAPESRRSFVPAAVVLAVVVLLAAAGWLAWRSLARRGNPAPAPTPITVTTAASAPPARSEPAAVPVPAPAPPPAVMMPAPYTNPPAPPPVPYLGSAPVPPPFPELKLQGIFYSRGDPKASINGEIHRENEFIGEVRIVTISPNKVTVEWKGQTKDLNLGGE